MLPHPLLPVVSDNTPAHNPQENGERASQQQEEKPSAARSIQHKDNGPSAPHSQPESGNYKLTNQRDAAATLALASVNNLGKEGQGYAIGFPQDALTLCGLVEIVDEIVWAESGVVEAQVAEDDLQRDRKRRHRTVGKVR